MLSAEEIVALQDEMTRRWHEPNAPGETVLPEAAGKPRNNREWLELVARQHRANFDLWHIEDEARAPGATDAELAAVKRRIALSRSPTNVRCAPSGR